jgi:tyrosine-protein kinase Etk/Wzc
VNVLDPAIIPKKPISPNVILNLVFGSLSGLFLGVVIVVVRSRLDDRIRGPEDLKKRGIVPLGTIGRFQIENQKNGKNGHAVPAEMARLSPNLVAFTSPFSAMSEGYRHLRTNLLFIQPDKPIRTILVSSSSPQEGKSTTVANLAISFAQGENRVLLVDADMRRPTANTLFGVTREPGLSNVISNPSSLEVAVHRRVLENLDVLSSGTVPPNPAEILGSRRMREFIERVKSSYDIVIFDSPPLLAATDAAILSSMVDVALIVVRAGETGFALLERAAEILQGVGKNPAGIVVNNFDAGTAYGGYYGRHRRETYAYAYGYGANGDGKSKDHRSKTKN